jgi:uncharacterized protein YcnI
MRSRSYRRAVVAVAAAVAGVLLAGTASAHVTVNPSQATQEGFAKLAFRVPNEKDSASTVKLEVNLPTDQPVAFVSLRPQAGWTAQVDRSRLDKPIKSDDGEVTEAVTKITWTASGDAAIKPGQFQEFEISLGPLPKADKMVFKALQTYSDGEVVRWIEKPGPGNEPDHPAPVLTLTPKAADAQFVSAAGGAAAAKGRESGSGDHSGTMAVVAICLAVAGLLAGLAGLVAGLRGRRRTPSTAA